MHRRIRKWILLTATGVLISGCVVHKSVVYQDVERARIEFESDAAARLFYETLSKTPKRQNHSESTTTIAIPIVFEGERKIIPGRNVEFNQAVSDCDSNRDGKITELEARIFANHR